MLVYFYPKADTPGCTAQSCGLRDISGQVGDTVILGISPDKPAKQKKFDTKYGLGFPLLADEDHAVAEAYDVWTEKSMYGKKYMGILRSAFLIDEKGKVAQAWYKVSPADTAKNLLAVDRRLNLTTGPARVVLPSCCRSSPCSTSTGLSCTATSSGCSAPTMAPTATRRRSSLRCGRGRHVTTGTSGRGSSPSPTGR